MSIEKNEIVAGGKYVPKFVVSSGSYKLDALLNHRGYPSGAMIHLMSSKEGSFKTSFSLMGLANVQKLGHNIGFVDAEFALDPDWAEGIGVDINDETWFYSMPTVGETALDHVEEMLKEHDCKGVVLDSIDGCQPSKYMENDYGDSVMMQHAKLIGKFARRASKLAKEHDAIIWAINQMRTGKQGHVTFNKASGGKGLPFYSKINLEMKRKSQSANQGDRILDLSMNIRRNKMGPSFRTIETKGIQGEAIDQTAELVDLAQELGHIYRAGSWWKEVNPEAESKDDDFTLGQSLEDAKEWVHENEDLILDELS